MTRDIVEALKDDETSVTTIGDLIKFLKDCKEMYGDIPIEVYDQNGNCRECVGINFTSISTVLTSYGKGIQW